MTGASGAEVQLQESIRMAIVTCSAQKEMQMIETIVLLTDKHFILCFNRMHAFHGVHLCIDVNYEKRLLFFSFHMCLE